MHDGDPGHRGSTEPHRVRRAVHFVVGRRPCFAGLAGALVFFCLAMTPTLLPRGAVTQGVLCGAAAAIGYGIASGLSAGVRKLLNHEPSRRVKRISWWILLAATVVLVPVFVRLGSSWQDDVRRLVGVSPQDPWSGPMIAVVAVAVAALLLVVSRIVRGFARALGRLISTVIPPRISVPVAVAMSVIVVVGLLQGFLLTPLLNGVSAIYSANNGSTSEGVRQPTSPYRSGSPASLVAWDTLGEQGRDFTGEGSGVGATAAQLAAFNGRPALDPIRVYVGIDSAPTLEERVQLAIRELDRTKAWERKVVVVFTTTGTGWVDERAASPLEYMFNGDTAEVGLQYSFLPSWISFLVDDQKAADAGTEMIHAVQERLSTMPSASRPKLFVFGESLGSFGTESAFSDAAQMAEGVDGGLFEGPVFKNHIHNELTADRSASSPAWRPVYLDGANYRFAVDPADVGLPPTPWGTPRIVYLQNSSDPITYFNFDLWWRRPEWLNKPRGPDVSGDMVWIPGVSFWQVAADMMFSTKVPVGHGHNYGINAVDAWASVAAPPGWSASKTEQLRAVLASPKS